MNVTTNIIVLTFIISFAIYMGTPEHHSSLFLGIVSGNMPQLYSSLNTQLMVLFSLSAIASVAAVLLGQGISYALFAGIATFILSFMTLPVDVITEADIPIEIKTLLLGVFGIMYVMSMLSWFKGGTDM